jgi:nitroreductase
MGEGTAANLIEFLRGQRQSRQFTDEPVSDEDLEAILQVARWTGSSKNTQPWQFVVVTDPAIKAEIGKATQWTGWAADAPVVIVTVTDGDKPRAHDYDEGRVSERILLAAQALGLGSGVITFGTDEARARVRAALKVPAGHQVYSAVPLGHAVPRTSPHPLAGRKPLSELVHRETFGNR